MILKRLRLLLTLALALFVSSPTFASEPNLEGLWFEADNFPASSVVRFERFGAGWIGRYVKVSPQQKGFGFAVGEAVIRGLLKENQFKGEVLLKVSEQQFVCPGLTAGWVPIQMEFVGSDKLNGRWLQTVVDYRIGCDAPIKKSWQPYRLEKLTTQ